MYYEYFGLKQPPFRITPDTNLFFPGANRGAILEALVYAVGNGEGIVKVVGEVGSGKTMLCRMLEQELPDRVEVVYLANPSLSPENILHAIAFELKLPVSADTPRVEVMRALQEYLLRRHAENRQVVVFVEEAQGMPVATLEEIRLLSNLETRQNKLLQIVLFGQPELDEKLAQPEIRQLKERITYSFQLPPFNPVDIRDYLNARVRACGYRAAELFSPGAVHDIARYSRGLVRRINIIADKSLLAAYADTNIQVGRTHVAKAVKDSEFTAAPRRAWLVPAAAAGVATLLLAAGAWWVFQRPGPSEPVAAAAPPAPESAGIAPPRPEPVPAAVSAGDPRVTETVAGVMADAGEAVGVASSDTPPAQETTAAVSPGEIPGTPAGAGPLAAPAPMEAVQSGAEPAPPRETRPAGVNAGDATAAPETDTGSAGQSGAGIDAVLSAPGQGPDSPPVFHWVAEPDARLTVPEMARLQQDIARLPPEDAPVSGAAAGMPPCEICTVIVYRPLPEPESL